MKALIGTTLGVVGLLLAGCDFNLKSASRFRLPQGNAEKGKAAFIALNCIECHTVQGVALPSPAQKGKVMVALGGDVARLRTVGDLLTAIVHPNLAISDKVPREAGVVAGKSPMPDVNDTMTVRQMIDLVTFLQPRYTQLPPPIDMHYPL
jgi:sulfur-oxidizing protein SoxX